jgi:hypothetical protein
MSIAKDFIKFLNEADDEKKASGRFTITTSGSYKKQFVDKLDDAVDIVNKFPETARIVITDGNKNNNKVVFGLKKTAMAVLMSMTKK